MAVCRSICRFNFQPDAEYPCLSELRYSGPQQLYVTNANTNGPLWWTQWNLPFTQWGYPFAANGWTYDLPSLTGQSKLVELATNQSTNQTSVCIGNGNYVLRGFDGVQRTLSVGDM